MTLEDYEIRAPEHLFQSASLNGKPLNRAWLRYDEIISGGKLELEMSSNPNRSWGLGK